MSTAYPLRRALAANSTASAFAAKIPLATEPTGVGVFDLFDSDAIGLQIPKYAQLIPFGTDANDETFDMRLYGWSQIGNEALYVPQLLLDVSVILGNQAGTVIAASTFMADTLTVNDGAADNGPWRSLIDCQEDLPASVLVHLRGCRWLEFDFDMILAASGNCLFRLMQE